MNEEQEQPKIVEVEPGEIVLRVEPVRESPQAPAVEPVEYCRPLPRERRYWLDEITWPRVLLGLFILYFVAAVFLIPKPHRSEQARFTASKTDLINLQTALDAFEIDMGRYPRQNEGLGILLTGTGPNWHGPYIKMIPNDPWGTPYFYLYPGVHNVGTFDLHSRGPDRREGNDDINNW